MRITESHECIVLISCDQNTSVASHECIVLIFCDKIRIRLWYLVIRSEYGGGGDSKKASLCAHLKNNEEV